MALTNHERKWVKMPAKPPMRSGSIGRVRDSLVARFEMLVRQRATDAGLPPSEFRDWVMGIVGEGVALALRDIDRWDEHRASFLTWSFLKTRSLVNKELRQLRNQVRTGYLEMDPPRQPTLSRPSPTRRKKRTTTPPFRPTHSNPTRYPHFEAFPRLLRNRDKRAHGKNRDQYLLSSAKSP